MVKNKIMFITCRLFPNARGHPSVWHSVNTETLITNWADCLFFPFLFHYEKPLPTLLSSNSDLFKSRCLALDSRVS
jgi:hypothetical protein